MAGRGLDHLVLGVRDLDAAADFYGRLGFTVGALNKHPWGTWNRLVQFPGCFLEIITVGEPEKIPEHAPGRFSFGAFVRDALARGEGLAMLALESADSAATRAEWHAAGISPYETFFFERRGRRPDGSDVRVAFTLAFARDDASPEAGFFVCEQHEPQNFWNPMFQSHANGATGIAEVTFGAPEPQRHRDFLARFTGVIDSPADEGGHGYLLPRGRITLRPDQGAAGWRGFNVLVPDLEAVAQRVAHAGIPASRRGVSLVIPPSAGFGVEIAFSTP